MEQTTKYTKEDVITANRSINIAYIIASCLQQSCEDMNDYLKKVYLDLKFDNRRQLNTVLDLSKKLIKAIDNFDPSLGLMLSTYACPLILGEVKRYIRDTNSIRITRSIRDLTYNIMKYKEGYYSIHGIYPKNEEIKKALNIEEYQLKEAIDSLKDPMSIYEPIYNDGGDTIYLESHNICIKGQESYYFYDNTGLFGTLTIADSIEKAKDYLYNYFSKQNIKVNITI